MTSVRISHQNQGRGCSPSALGGDHVRFDAGEGTRFADALGAAGMVRKDANGGSAGSTPGDAANYTATLRRRTEADGKSGNTTAALVAEGLVAPRAIDDSDPQGMPASNAGAEATSGRQSVMPTKAPTDPLALAAADLGMSALPKTVAGASVPAFTSAAQAEPAQGSADTSTANDPPAGPGLAELTASVAGSLRKAAPGAEQSQAMDDLTVRLLLPGASPAAVLEAPGAVSSLASVAANASPDLPAMPSFPASSAALSVGSSPIVADSAGDSDRAAGDRGEDRGRFTPISVALEHGGDSAATSLDGAGQVSASAAGSATAPTTVVEAGAAATIPEQVAGALIRLTSSGSREMVMRLHPAELGDLTVRVAVSGRDVTAWFTSPQPHVQNVINDAMGQLQTGLGNAGYNLTNAWIGDGRSGNWQRSAQSPPPQDSAAPAADSSSPGVVGSRASSSGMSIYV